MIWTNGDATLPPKVHSVQYSDAATCEANKARAMAVTVATYKADGFDPLVMRGVVACSHLTEKRG